MICMSLYQNVICYFLLSMLLRIRLNQDIKINNDDTERLHMESEITGDYHVTSLVLYLNDSYLCENTARRWKNSTNIN